MLAATEHTQDGLEYRLHLVELSHVFAKGNLVVDIFAEVSAMTTMHEGFYDSYDCCTLSNSGGASETVPPGRSTFSCSVELLDRIRFKLQAVRIDF
jgi:hypothetical protein